MSNELKIIPRAVEHDIYRIYCADNDFCHRELEIETKTILFRKDQIVITFEDIEYSCDIIDVYHNLYKHRISETVVSWQYQHKYTLREIVCQEKEKLNESMVEGSKTP